MRPAAEVGEVALRVERDVALGGVDELDLVVLALGLEALPRLVARDLLALATSRPPRARAGSPPRSARARPRRSARGTRSRSRSRSRSAGRSRSSRRGRGGARPRRAGAPPSGAGRRARRDRPCRASSGSGSAGRPRAAARRSCTRPFERTSTASSASFGPIAAAASSPVAPSGSSSSDESGRNDAHGRDGSAAPPRGRPKRRGRRHADSRPRRGDRTAEDDPGAD